MKKTIFDNNTFVMVLSIIVSVLIWVVVAYNIDTSIPSTIRNVPVIVNTGDGNLQRLGLSPIDDVSEFTVDIEVIGARATVGNIKLSEIQVEAKLNNVTAPGTYELPLEVIDVRNRQFEIKAVYPETVQIRFDRTVTKKFDIDLKTSGVHILDGYIMEEEYLYPTQIEVTGPATEMEQITGAMAELILDEPIAGTATYDVPIALINDDGDTVESPYFKTSIDSTAVTMPVLKKKVVPVTFDFVNVPEGFDVDVIDYVLTPDEVEIAAPENMLDTMNELHLGYIDMRTLAPDMNMFYNMSLPPSFISVEGIEELNLQFKPDKFAEKELNIDSESIYVINASDKYDVTIQSKSVSGVVIYGPAEQLEKITEKDLVAQINMSRVEYKLGQVTVPVDIVIPGKSDCWAYGSHYTVRATIKLKE